MAGVLQDERACFFGVRPDPNDEANSEFLGAGVGAYKAWRRIASSLRHAGQAQALREPGQVFRPA